MNDTVAVVVAHRLGKVEAVRRLSEGFARTNGQLGAMVAMEHRCNDSRAMPDRELNR